jgi:hypothetical protein
MPVSEKAELYYLLREDKELENYLISNDRLYKKLARRDKGICRKENRFDDKPATFRTIQANTGFLIFI